MATIKDIARKTGLSINTVSRAIRKSGYVSAKAAELVEKAVRELDYHPNQAARNLRLKSTREIAVIALSCDYLHIEKVVGIRDYALEHGYQTTVHFAKDSEDAINDILPEILKLDPAGVIFIASNETLNSKIRQLRDKLPCVIASMFPTEGSDCVCVDRFAGVYNAVQYLHRCGRRRILFIETAGAKQRREGYLQAVKDLGLPELIMPATSMDLETIRTSGIDAARKIAGMTDMPDAIQTSDYLACGMLPEFIRLGIRVPEEIAVIGFDDREIAAMTTPPLTTIAHPGEEVGAACAKMIIDRIESGFCSDAMPECVKISMKLVIRQST